MKGVLMIPSELREKLHRAPVAGRVASTSEGGGLRVNGWFPTAPISVVVDGMSIMTQ